MERYRAVSRGSPVFLPKGGSRVTETARLEMKGIGKEYYGNRVLKDVSFSLGPGRTLSLVGEEHATYRRGTDTVTDKHTFYDEPLLETSSLAEIVKGGHFEAVIPCDVMHSFEADNNKITWTIRAAGDIKRWPDMKAEFRLVIQPMNPEAIAHA